jgi:hypothetical protein
MSASSDVGERVPALLVRHRPIEAPGIILPQDIIAPRPPMFIPELWYSACACRRLITTQCARWIKRSSFQRRSIERQRTYDRGVGLNARIEGLFRLGHTISAGRRVLRRQVQCLAPSMRVEVLIVKDSGEDVLDILPTQP